MEADVFPRDRPQDSILIDGGIGERSIFHETFGYYAHGVDESTATLPAWRDRLVPIRNENTARRDWLVPGGLRSRRKQTRRRARQRPRLHRGTLPPQARRAGTRARPPRANIAFWGGSGYSGTRRAAAPPRRRSRKIAQDRGDGRVRQSHDPAARRESDGAQPSARGVAHVYLLQFSRRSPESLETGPGVGAFSFRRKLARVLQSVFCFPAFQIRIAPVAASGAPSRGRRAVDGKFRFRC